MRIIDLLNKIANGEMEEAIFYVCGDFFYDLIVIDKELYVINTITKRLEPLENKYISRFIKDNVELIRLDKLEEILEKKKIPEKLPFYSLEKIQKAKNKDEWQEERISLLEKIVEDLHVKINDLIDYLKSKGE